MIAALLSFPAAAHAQFHFTGMDGMMQTVKQEGQSAFSGLGLRGRITSDDLPVHLTLMPTLEYWRNSANLRDFNIEAAQKDLALGLDARYEMAFGTWHPYAGGGLAAHFINSTLSAPSQGIERAQQDHTKFAPDILAGLQLAPLGPIQSFLEVKYAFVTDYQQFKLNWGLGVNF
jgi:hypothetical protein